MQAGIGKSLLALGILGSVITMPLTAMAQERFPENTILSQGVGVVTAQPDTMQLNLGVETEGKTSEAARNANAQKMNAILARLRGLGIPGLVLKTAHFNVYPIRESERPDPRGHYSGRPDQIIGYRAHNQIMARVEGEDNSALASYASRLIDSAVGAGATNVDGPNFFLSKNNKAQQEALKLAVRQARENAEAVAQAAGVRIVGVYSIDSYAQHMPLRGGVMMMNKAEAAEAAAPTPIEPGDFEVTSNVTVRYDIQD